MMMLKTKTLRNILCYKGLGLLVPRAGLEPAAIGFEAHYSIQLSYRGTN